MKTFLARLHHIPNNSREFIYFIIWGVAAGLGAVLFQLSVRTLFDKTIKTFSGHGLARFALESFIIVAVTSLIAGFLMARYSREAAGSGVPQLKLAYWKNLGYVPFRAVWRHYKPDNRTGNEPEQFL